MGGRGADSSRSGLLRAEGRGRVGLGGWEGRQLMVQRPMAMVKLLQQGHEHNAAVAALRLYGK
jgi:hypothetical protein